MSLEHLKMTGRRIVTEDDVWAAADGLLLEGDRATVLRVREVLGRGSPNTIAPVLDRWYKSLGKRIRDPGSFAPAGELPQQVAEAAAALWQTACVEAADETNRRVAQALRESAETVKQAHLAAESAKENRDMLSAEVTRLGAQVTSLLEQLDAEKVAHGRTSGRMYEIAEQLRIRNKFLSASEAELETERQTASSAIAAAESREKRALADLEREVARRQRAEQRAETLEAKIEAAQILADTQRDLQFKELTRASVEVASLQGQTIGLQAELDRRRSAAGALQSELDAARDGASRSAQEVATLREILSPENKFRLN